MCAVRRADDHHNRVHGAAQQDQVVLRRAPLRLGADEHVHVPFLGLSHRLKNANSNRHGNLRRYLHQHRFRRSAHDASLNTRVDPGVLSRNTLNIQHSWNRRLGVSLRLALDTDLHRHYRPDKCKPTRRFQVVLRTEGLNRQAERRL